jgi:hypothetical protein
MNEPNDAISCCRFPYMMGVAGEIKPSFGREGKK